MSSSDFGKSRSGAGTPHPDIGHNTPLTNENPGDKDVAGVEYQFRADVAREVGRPLPQA
jgi:hypothetical protein